MNKKDELRSHLYTGYLTSIDPFLQDNVDDENVARTYPKTKANHGYDRLGLRLVAVYTICSLGE